MRTTARHGDLALHVPDFEPQDLHVVDPSAVLFFTPCKGRVLDLELLLEQTDLVISTNHLRPEDVPFINHGVVLLPLRQGLRGAVVSRREVVDARRLQE